MVLVVLLAGGGRAAHAEAGVISSEKSLRAGKGQLNQAVYTRDGRQLVTAGFDKVVRLWDAQTGKEASAFSGAKELVDSVAVSPDGQRIVAGSRDGVLTAWKVANGEVAFSVPAHGGAIWSVRFDPGGGRLVSASQDGTVKVWDASTGRELRKMKHGAAVWTAVFTPDGKRVASASFDRTVRMWDARSGRAIRTFEGHTKEVLALDVSPDGRTLASGGNDRTLRIWNAATGALVQSLPQPDIVNSVAFSPEGRWLAVAVGDPVELGPRSDVRILVADGWKPLSTLSATCGILFNVAVHPSGETLAAACADGSVQIWPAPR